MVSFVSGSLHSGIYRLEKNSMIKKSIFRLSICQLLSNKA